MDWRTEFNSQVQRLSATKPQSSIEIIRTATGYNAKYHGWHRAAIVKLFNTDILPTPYTTAANAQDVVRDIQRRNPDVEVYLS